MNFSCLFRFLPYLSVFKIAHRRVMSWRKLVFPSSFKLFLSICLLLSSRPNAWCQASFNAAVNDTTYLLTYDHGGQILWGLSHFQERLNNAKEWLDKYPEFKIGL
ncbi:MAG: hypothetical protein C5B59_10100, partial [Bacteroidetes bacterium]